MTNIMRLVSRHFSETMHLSPEATARILAKVRLNLARDLDALEQGLENEDATRLAARLHKLKGDFSNIGLSGLAEMVLCLERECARLPREELRQTVTDLRQTVAPLLEEQERVPE